jgi:hypothetical protein
MDLHLNVIFAFRTGPPDVTIFILKRIAIVHIGGFSDPFTVDCDFQFPQFCSLGPGQNVVAAPRQPTEVVVKIIFGTGIMIALMEFDAGSAPFNQR